MKEERLRNNIRAIGIHLSYIIVLFIFTLCFIGLSQSLGPYINVESLVFKVISIIILITSYIIGGFFLDTNSKKGYDFFCGTSIFIVGVILWIISLGITKGNLYEINYDMQEYWILLDVFILPIKFSFNLININITPIVLLISTTIPSLLMGIGWKIKRYLNIKNNI